MKPSRRKVKHFQEPKVLLTILHNFATGNSSSALVTLGYYKKCPKPILTGKQVDLKGLYLKQDEKS